MSIPCIPDDKDVRERIVICCIGIAIAAMVGVAAVSGWRVNSELEQARMERVERLENRVGRLEGRRCVR